MSEKTCKIRGGDSFTLFVTARYTCVARSPRPGSVRGPIINYGPTNDFRAPEYNYASCEPVRSSGRGRGAFRSLVNHRVSFVRPPPQTPADRLIRALPSLTPPARGARVRHLRRPDRLYLYGIIIFVYLPYDVYVLPSCSLIGIGFFFSNVKNLKKIQAPRQRAVQHESCAVKNNIRANGCDSFYIFFVITTPDIFIDYVLYDSVS